MSAITMFRNRLNTANPPLASECLDGQGRPLSGRMTTAICPTGAPTAATDAGFRKEA